MRPGPIPDSVRSAVGKSQEMEAKGSAARFQRGARVQLSAEGAARLARLRPRQLLMLELFLAGLPAGQAARQAGYAKPDQDGSRLVGPGGILAGLVVEMRSDRLNRAAARAEMSLDRWLVELVALREGAIGAGRWSAAVTAHLQLGKILRFDGKSSMPADDKLALATRIAQLLAADPKRCQG